MVLVFLGHASRHYSLPLIETLESIVYDTRLTSRMPDPADQRVVDTRIVILDIDEKSLAEREKGGEGHWPWPRDRLALLLDKLFDRYEIAVLGFDIVFAERNESSAIREFERLAEGDLRDDARFQSAFRQRRPELDYDGIFARKMRGRPVVLSYTFSTECPAQEGRNGLARAIGDSKEHTAGPAQATRKGLLPEPILRTQAFAAQPINAPCFAGYIANLEMLQKSAAGGGHFNPVTDADSIIRRVPMLIEYDGAYYEPLSLAMVRVLLGSPPVKPIPPDEKFTPKSYPGLEWLEVGSLRIPVDATASALVPYRGRQGSFKYISVVDVLNDSVDIGELKGKLVLVGTTARALFDLRATPMQTVYPGVEIHANMIAGILDGDIKQQLPYVVGAEFMLLLLSGLTMALLLALVKPLISTITTVAVLFALIAVNVAVYDYGNLVLPLASGLVMILLLFTLNMAYGFFIEERGARQMTKLFGEYVPPELVGEMARDPKQYSMAPSKKVLSVLFSDVRGFTSISEFLSPEDLSSYTNDFLTTMSLVIREKHGGTLDKYMGDNIMAFWGAPVPDTQHARNAVLAAFDMQIEAKALNEKFKEKGWPPLKIGIGVNSGEMSVGDMGSKIRRAYTVMGDAVNTASRLEGLTKEFGADIIVGEGTRRLLSGFVLRELNRVRVKGKDESVTIYEPLGLEGQVDPSRLDEVKLWNQALRLYRSQDWDRAELQLLNLRKIAPDCELYEVFIKRIAHHRAHPPGPGWDGTWIFETK